MGRFIKMSKSGLLSQWRVYFNVNRSVKTKTILLLNHRYFHALLNVYWSVERSDFPWVWAVKIKNDVVIGFSQGAVQVKLELGHRAQVRKKPTVEGFTHDWMVFVRGPEHSNIQHFVEKVVFHLHESFPKPKRGKRTSSFCSRLAHCFVLSLGSLYALRSGALQANEQGWNLSYQASIHSAGAIQSLSELWHLWTVCLYLFKINAYWGDHALLFSSVSTSSGAFYVLSL